ncbi:GNAT family N-acetyltransferase [Streptomyces sp. YC504]|uniref:GNAT family N-acetyltransferase n=1 Tax=Streptomyces mesophilus TaxID=1775132 RepID=A0A6G4XXA2_9ACTN|nr:GNAT family N-acetyltransferase [Streptomyces mesophilus]NGO81437.1 GNAT family N-acetyltransferase [Streptomyces mesophilus]
MEIIGGGLLEIRINRSDVGKRVSVRSLTDAGAPGGKFTDTVGVLTSWNDDVLLITRRDGTPVRIPESRLVAGKVVPAAPARRRGPAASFEELARVAARSWQPVESERLGDWELRAADGFTRRANSVLALGDPGMPLDRALAFVREWYAERGLPAFVQTSTGAEGTHELLCAELESRGWAAETHAQVRIGGLAPVGDIDADVDRVRLSRTCDEAWLSRYQRGAGRSPSVRGGGRATGGRFGEGSPAVLKVLHNGPSVWFASVPTDGGAPAAIGRCVVDGRWAGFMAVEVDPAYRRQGLATSVMTALARKALDEGASAAWLQVEADNAGAQAMYDAMGFAVHHHYHYHRATDPS